MFDSALDLITQAASNSLFIFFCCNLIIVLILMGSKPSPSCEQERESSIPVVSNTYANSMHSLDENKRLVEVEQLSNIEEATADHDEEETSNIGNENNEDDELRRRVEEFINKVNSGWKAELLRTRLV